MAGPSGFRHNPHVFEIGASLREARVKRGLSAADVQKAIRIRDRYLQALEEERWEQLPGDAYVKGFLRTYADFLGLDANLYVDEYNSRFARHDDQPLSPQPLARPEGDRVGLLRPLLVIGAIVAIVAAVAAWQLNRTPAKTAQNTTTGTTSTTATTSSGGTTTTKTRKRHHPQPAVALPARAILVAARGACWLELRRGSSSGPLLYENTLQTGQRLPVDLASGPVWMDIGNPPSLDVHLGGKLAQGLPSQAGNVLLTRRGLKPG